MKCPPHQSQNATAIAAHLCEKYHSGVSRKNIVDWKKLSPPFPAPDASGRYNKAECEEWFVENRMPKPTNAVEADLFQRSKIAEAELKITKAAEAKREHESELGKLIDKDAARRAVIGVAKSYHNIVRTKIEVHLTAARRDWLQTHGVAPEIVANFYEFDLTQSRAFIDAVEKECAEQGKSEI